MTQGTSNDTLESFWAEAEAAASRNDVPGVLRAWEALADRNVRQLCARIGEVYERGAPGVPKDIDQALRWYRRAIFELDDPIAHVGLGRAYYFGLQVDKNVDNARKHFEKAYEGGSPEGALYLGMLFLNGNAAGHRDIQTAREYLKFSALHGYFFAHFQLARIALEEHNWLSAVRHSIKGAHLRFKLLMNDENDPRLLGIQTVSVRPPVRLRAVDVGRTTLRKHPR